MSNYQTSMMLVVWYVVQIIVAVFSDTTADCHHLSSSHDSTL
jgi:hypothetical protein